MAGFFEKKYSIFVIAALSAVFVWLLYWAGLFYGLEIFFEDLMFFNKPIDNSVVIVAIDDESIQKIGQWPWPREIFGGAFQILDKNTPLVVGMDVVLSEPSRYGEKDDSFLSYVLKNISYPVVMPIEAMPLIINEGNIPVADKFLKPLDKFSALNPVSLGHVNLILDRDGVIRKFPLKINGINSFSYEILKKSGKEIKNENSLKLIERIVYSAPAGSIRRIPFWRLNDAGIAASLKDKIVLIGVTAPDLHDEAVTPFSRGKAMPGVEIQANIVNMLLRSYRFVNLNPFIMFFWILIITLLSATSFYIIQDTVKASLISALIGMIHVIFSVFLFEKGIVSNFIHLNLAWILSITSIFAFKYFLIEKDRRMIKNIFSKYVSKDVLENILNNPDAVALGGEEREITLLFCDIRGFTTFSEKLKPKELVRVLNRYFSVMTSEILNNGGVLDKYIGDAIMAFWGAPIEDAGQADKAIKASLSMVEKLKKLNKELASAGEPEIKIGIGLYTGPAIVGNVGSYERFDYTAIGDTVNVASRLEGLTKEYGVQIIVGESVKNKATEKYNYKFLGSASVKGRKEPLDIYTIS